MNKMIGIIWETAYDQLSVCFTYCTCMADVRWVHLYGPEKERFFIKIDADSPEAREAEQNLKEPSTIYMTKRFGQ